ncbi:MAG: Glu/Leu/Phe/Val dehydrogenase dimerization domain-containing protein [Deltaproteobacteria bacterium]
MYTIQTLNKNEFEEIVYCRDEKVGLNAIIAIHDTTLGPGTGGARMYFYQREEEALNDVLRLSFGMTYKAAISHLPFGGGKSVIIGDPERIKTEALLLRFGEYVESLKGRYICAKDVGINGADLRIIARKTNHILGVEGLKNSSGDPSPATAYGVVQAIRAISKEYLNRNSLEGLKFAVQGLGSVGHGIVEELYNEGAELTVCDVDREAIGETLKKCNVEGVDPQKIYDVKCDFFVPCAMGAVLNSDTIPRLQCKVVAGAANNQLANVRDGYDLAKRGIFYAPDYVINAGGLINIAEELPGYNRDRAFEHVAKIYQTMVEIIHRSRKEDEPPFVIADRIAQEILTEAKRSHKP